MFGPEMMRGGGMGGMMDMMKLLKEKNGIAKLLSQPIYPVGDDPEAEPTASQADLVADLINLQRLDLKRIAEEEGIEMEVQRITPEKTALLLQYLVKGDSLELVDKFNGGEEMREEILAELISEEELEAHRELKEQVVFSPQPAEPDEDVVEALEGTSDPFEEAEESVEEVDSEDGNDTDEDDA